MQGEEALWECGICEEVRQRKASWCNYARYPIHNKVRAAIRLSVYLVRKLSVGSKPEVTRGQHLHILTSRWRWHLPSRMSLIALITHLWCEATVVFPTTSSPGSQDRKAVDCRFFLVRQNVARVRSTKAYYISGRIKAFMSKDTLRATVQLILFAANNSRPINE